MANVNGLCYVAKSLTTMMVSHMDALRQRDLIPWKDGRIEAAGFEYHERT
jgi:hypothetical protein